MNPNMGIILAVRYTINAQEKLVKDLTYRGQRQLQIIKCKYSTDENIQDVIDHNYDIFEPLRLALQTHGSLNSEVEIIPIDTFNVKSLPEIAQLLSFKEEPSNVLTFKQLPTIAKNS